MYVNNGLNEAIEALNSGFTDSKLKQIATFPQRFQSICCADAVRILGKLSFDDDKVKALEYIAPVIYDRAANQTQIINAFTFSSNKDKAISILNRTPAPQPGYPQPGYPQPGYPQPGYPQPGYPQPQPGYPQPGYPQPGYPQPSYPPQTNALNSAIDALKQNFDNDKLKMVATFPQRFQSICCADTARILRLFSFDNDKFRALEYLAPIVYDKATNQDKILDVFAFDSEKNNALSILNRSQGYPGYPQPGYPQPGYPHPHPHPHPHSPHGCPGSSGAGINIGFPGVSLNFGFK